MMIVIAVIATALAVVGVALYMVYRRHATSTEPAAPRPDGECCGQHAVCERDSLLAAASREIVYYDDEELDRWRGTAADAYDETQLATFRDVFYTMQPADVPGWVRSLQLRGIELPDALKDEVLLVVTEQRAQRHQKETTT